MRERRTEKQKIVWLVYKGMKLPLFLLSTVLFLVGMTVIIVICSGVLRVFQRTSQRTGSRIHSDGQLGQHNYLAAPVPLPLR